MNKRIGRLVSILYRKNQVYLNAALKPYDITSSEQSILMYLYKKNDVSQEEIGHYLQIDKASMTRTIQSLLEKGFVFKEKDAHDKRCNKISLTGKGRSMKKIIVSKLDEWNDFLMSDLEDQQMQMVFETLLEIVEKVENLDFKEWEKENGNDKSIRN